MSIKISIITINYNNREGLEKTISSVTSQTYAEVEYIVIDGGSDDGSLDVLKQNADNIDYWVSEKDNGVYHAMNKGIAKATGDYLLFLNSGDFFIDSNVLQNCTSQHDFKEDIIYGDLMIKKEGKEPYKKIYPEVLSFNYFYNRESLPHPASFIRRDLFDRVDRYNESFKIIADWEFWLKALFLYSATYKKLPITISQFDLEGMSSIPENSNRIDAEKNIVYSKYFSRIIDDYREWNVMANEYRILKSSVESSRVIKLLRKLQLIKL